MGFVAALFLVVCSFVASNLSFCFLGLLPLVTSGVRAGRFFAWCNTIRWSMCVGFSLLVPFPVAIGVVSTCGACALLFYCTKHHPFFSGAVNRFWHMVCVSVLYTSILNFCGTTTMPLYVWAVGLLPASLLGLLVHWGREKYASTCLKVTTVILICSHNHSLSCLLAHAYCVMTASLPSFSFPVLYIFFLFFCNL